MNINHKLFFAFTVISLLVLGIGIVLYNDIVNINSTFLIVQEKTTPAIIALSDVKTNLFFILLETNEYILEPSQEHLEELEEGKTYIKEALIQYQKAEIGEEEEISKFIVGTTKVISLSDEIINLQDSDASLEIMIEKSMELDELAEILIHEIDNEIDHDTAELRASQEAVGNIVDQSLLVVIAFVIIAFSASTVIALATSHSILKPLTKLRIASAEISKGNFDVEVNGQSQDEIGELSSSFDKMRRWMKNTNTNLENKVSERTNELEKAYEELKKLNKTKEEFLSMITHELKTPLVPIKGYSDMLLSEHLGKLTSKQKERIAIIKSSSESLLAMISDLLDAQKLGLGQLRMSKVSSNIKDTIDNAIETLKPQCEQNNVEISSNAVDFTINHDPERIRQVITNLIKNSLTAVEPNSGKIELIMENLPTEIKISVKDNGIGIPLEKQKDLFTKFYQVDTTLTRDRSGSGLGLAICKGIIENHGGKIWVTSEGKSNGSEFNILLPYNKNINNIISKSDKSVNKTS